MPDYVKLSSEKYLAASLQLEKKQNRAAKRRDAFHSFLIFTGSLAVFAATFFVFSQNPQWIKTIVNWF